jgi:pimeloyl-ACP methyl ester carboxylesterase
VIGAVNVTLVSLNLLAMSVPTPHAELLSRIPVSSHAIEVLGSTTRYWDYGPKDARDTVVIAHGYRGDHHGFEPVVARLPGIRFISPDLPGFGDSTPLTEAGHDIAGYVRWLGAFIAALDLDAPPVVLGHSFGSMVSTRAIAEGMPARALILVNPIATDPKVGAGVGMVGITRAFYGVSRALPRPLADLLLRSWLIVQFMSMSLVTTDDAELRRWIHEEHHRYFNGYSDPRTVADAFRASLEAEIGCFAPDVTVPTLMVAGAVDRITPLDGQYRSEKLFPDARLVVIPSVGHLVHYETPGAAADAITAFLDELAA